MPRLEWMNLAAEKNEESPKSEIELEDFESTIDRSNYPEGEEGTQQYLTAVSAERSAAKEKIWREKVGLPTYEEYLADFKKKHGIEDEAEPAAETQEDEEDDPNKSLWSKLSKQERRDLIRRHHRRHGEQTADWAKRIEAEEGMKIFSANFGEGVDAGEDQSMGDQDTTEADLSTDSDVAAEIDSPEAEGVSSEESDEAGAASQDEAVTDDAPNPPEASSEADDRAAVQPESAAEDVNWAGAQSEPSADETVAERSVESGAEAENEARMALMRSLADEAHGDWLQAKNINREALRNMSLEELRALSEECNSESTSYEGGDPEVSGETDNPPAAETEAAKPETSQSRIRGIFEAAGFRVRERKVVPKGAEAPKSGEGTREKTFSQKVESGELSTAEAITVVERDLDKAFKYEDISKAWTRIEEIIENSNDTVKAHIGYDVIKKGVESLSTSLSDKKAELRKMPRFTFPRSTARSDIEYLKKQIAGLEDELTRKSEVQEKAFAALPEITDETDLQNISGILHLRARADYLHQQSNVRDENSRSHYYESKGYHETSREDMRKASSVQRGIFERNHQDYLAMRRHVESYQTEHPDFILEPGADDVTPDVPPIEYTTNVKFESPRVEDIDESGVDEDLDSAETDETQTPLEKAQERYAEAEKRLSLLGLEMAMMVSLAGPDDDIGKIRENIADRHRQYEQEKRSAERDMILEGGLEVIPEAMHDEWRRELDENSQSAFELDDFRFTNDIIRAIKAGDTDSASSTLRSAYESDPADYREIIGKLNKYGDDEVRTFIDGLDFEADEAQAA